MTTKQKRTFAKLGYSQVDTAEMVTVLNRLLSGYSVYQQKLRNFHWNITGQDFFEIHNLFENMYKRAITETDEIAERIRLFGQRPASNFTEYLKISTVEEVSAATTSFEMAKIILSDIRTLLESMEDGINAAQEIGDNGTEYILKSFIYNMEKEHWILTSWIKQNV